jgi:hypothetical protein
MKTWTRPALVALAILGIAALSGCDDACYQFCEETVVCNVALDDPDFETEVDDCYQVYVDQGVGDPVLGAGIEETCRVSLQAWEGCPNI